MDVLDSYSGHTDPGGAAIRRDLPGLSITKLSVGPMDNNAYLLTCRATNEALLVDAANEADRLADLVGTGDTRADLRHIVTTHRHGDHWQALGAIAGMFETRQIAHPEDAPELPIPTDELVSHGDTVSFGRIVLRCPYTGRSRRWRRSAGTMSSTEGMRPSLPRREWAGASPH